MQSLIILWSFIGTIYLMFLTYQDLKHNMLIDDRKNYFMMGLTISFAAFSTFSVWYRFLVIGIALLLVSFINKFKLLGEGDANTILWTFYGFGLLNPIILITWIVFLGSISIIQAIIKLFMIRLGKIKAKKPIPFYPVLLITFILTCIFNNLYI